MNGSEGVGKAKYSGRSQGSVLGQGEVGRGDYLVIVLVRVRLGLGAVKGTPSVTRVEKGAREGHNVFEGSIHRGDTRRRLKNPEKEQSQTSQNFKGQR